MDNFPTKPMLSQGESPSMFDRQIEDNSNRADTDGGYEFRRRRFTRTRRSTIKTGFQGLPHSDYLTLLAFYEDKQTDTSFLYSDYIHNVVRQVRFDNFTPEYVGVGKTKLWNIKIQMSEI